MCEIGGLPTRSWSQDQAYQCWTFKSHEGKLKGDGLFNKWMSVSFQELYCLQGSLLWMDQRKHLLFPQTWDQVWHLSILIYVTSCSLYYLPWVTILTRCQSVSVFKAVSSFTTFPGSPSSIQLFVCVVFSFFFLFFVLVLFSLDLFLLIIPVEVIFQTAHLAEHP